MLHPILGSSIDPNKLSKTVMGILGWVITGVIFIAQLKGVPLTPAELQPIVDQIGDIIVMIGKLVSTVLLVYGGIRKVVVKFKK